MFDPSIEQQEFGLPRTLMVLIAHLTFWIVVLITAVQAGWRRVVAFVGLRLVGYVACAFLPLVGGYLFGLTKAVRDWRWTPLKCTA